MNEVMGTSSTKSHRASFGVIKSPNSRISRDTGWCLLGSAIPCSNARRNAKRSSPGRLPLTLHSIEAAGLVYFFSVAQK